MVTLRQNPVELSDFAQDKNVRYKTDIPSRVFFCSLSEIYQEIKKNRQGNIVFKNENGDWIAPIITVEIEHDASISLLWALGLGGIMRARSDYKEETAIAVVGYKEDTTTSQYYRDGCSHFLLFQYIPTMI